MNRAASPQPIQKGDILSLNSGRRCRGYIGDLCRMGIVGGLDSELQDLLAAMDVFQKAHGKVLAGVRGGEVKSAGEEAAASPLSRHLKFLAHGMGLVQREAPWLTAHSLIPCTAHDAERELKAGMVIS
jgi:Xaa-Pro aminopeptidase